MELPATGRTLDARRVTLLESFTDGLVMKTQDVERTAVSVHEIRYAERMEHRRDEDEILAKFANLGSYGVGLTWTRGWTCSLTWA